MILDYRKTLCSPELERHCLSGFLKFPELFPEVEPFAREDFFFHQSHRVIFSVARQMREGNKFFDAVILAQKIKDLNITFVDSIDLFSYVEILFSSPISFKAALESFNALKKQKVLLDLCEQTDKVKSFILDNRDKPINDIVLGVDQLNGEKLSIHQNFDQPVDLFEDLSTMIEKVAENPKEETGLKTPFKVFNEKFGGIRHGDGLYAIVSRSGIGKSSWLLAMGNGCARLNDGLKVLICDTEMKTQTSQFRLASSLTRVPMWYYETGMWKKNTQFVKSYEEGIKNTEYKKGCVFHVKVANKPINEVLSIIRRWFYKYVGKDGRALIIYDYLKLTGEKLSNFYGEHQAIGDKVNMLNDLSLLGEIYTWTAIQANRDGEDEEKAGNSSIVALSDRLQWFCNFNGHLRLKTADEIALWGPDSGSHVLEPLKARFRGRDKSMNSLVKLPAKGHAKRYRRDWINYDFNSFCVEERGTLRDLVAAREGKIDFEKGETPKPKEF